MKKKLNKKQLSLLISLLLLLTVSVGGTLAYIVTQTTPVTNTFTPAKVTCQVNETFQDDVKSKVTIKNTGTATAYIRAAIVVTWRDEQGNIGPKTPALNTDYVLTTSNDGWFKVGDYYYFEEAVAVNGATDVLITNCQLAEGVTPPEGYGLSVEIVADAIQADGGSKVGDVWKPAVEQAWGDVVSVNNDGSLSVKQ